jgi:hypothetical protein
MWLGEKWKIYKESTGIRTEKIYLKWKSHLQASRILEKQKHHMWIKLLINIHKSCTQKGQKLETTFRLENELCYTYLQNVKKGDGHSGTGP